MPPWTRLSGTPIWTKAQAAYQADPRRKFHTFYHVIDLYARADALGLPYDPDLDRAILGHDVVWDAGGNLELRSADWMRTHDPDFTDRADGLIMHTAHHTPGPDNRMVLLDLGGLAVPERVRPDYALIEMEGCAFTGRTAQEHACATASYLEGLVSRLTGPGLDHAPATDRPRIERIASGARQALSIAQTHLKRETE